MLRKLLLCAAILGALLALPFALRPELEKAVPADPHRDRLVIISSHNKGIRDEYDRAFREYYRKKHGRDVELDFRSPGGTSDIVRYIADRYETEFRKFWESDPSRGPWDNELAAAFRSPSGASSERAKLARKLFLDSDVGIGIDLMAGGGTFEMARQAAAGYAVDGGAQQRHPEYFRPEVIPASFGGDALYDAQGRYYAVVLSTFGICCNTDRLRETGAPPPERWSDLGEPRFFNLLALADPTKSGSANKCYEIIVQECMARTGAPAPGWDNGLNLLKRIFANARNVSDSAGNAVREVAQGEAAAGTAIDTYGFSEAAWQKKIFNGQSHILYVTPKGGTAVSSDPVQMLRGAPNRRVAEEFIDFLLSREGQLLHVLKQGVPGGPVNTPINRPPVRRDLYTPELRAKMFEPQYNPYESGADFVYLPQWTARYFGLLRIVIKALMLDPQNELRAAWSAILAAGGPERVPEAMRKFNALPFDYGHAPEAAALLRIGKGRSAAEVAATVRSWSDFARLNYLEAARLAREGK